MSSAYSHYEILDIPQSASEAEIKRAYYLMARRHHPDLHPHNKILAERRLRLINEAYDILKNRDSRAQYNRWLRTQAAQNDNVSNQSFFSQIVDIFRPAPNKNAAKRK